MKTKLQPTRQEAQDLILLAHRLIDNLRPIGLDLRELLLSLHEANLTLSFANTETDFDSHDVTPLFAIQLLDNPQLQNYDPSIEVII